MARESRERERGKAVQVQGRRSPKGRARTFYFRLKKLSTHARDSAAFGSGGAVSSSDDLWCENSISAPLSSLRCFFHSPKNSCLSVKKRQASATKTDRQRPPPPSPAITSLLCFMANLQPMDRRGEETECEGLEGNNGKAAAFIYIAKWPREKNEFVVGRFRFLQT